MSLVNETRNLIILLRAQKSINPYLYGYYDHLVGTYVVLYYSLSPFQKDLIRAFFNKYFEKLDNNNLYFSNKTTEELKQIILDTYFKI